MTKAEEALSLLRSKNRCLDRLMTVTQEVLLISDDKILEPAVNAPRVTPLELYDRERASVTKAVELFDGKITEIISAFTPQEKHGRTLEEVKSEMHKGELLLNAIFNADDIVFEKIARVQKRISTQLSENRRSREMLAKFKSQRSTDAGEEVDTTL